VTSGVRLLLLLASLAAGAALSTRMMLVLWAASLVAAVLTLSGLRRRVGLRLTGRGVWAELWWLVGRLRWNQVGALAARVPPLSLPLLVTWRAGAEANAGFFLSWQLAGGVFMVTAAVSQAFLAEAGDGTALAHRTARAVRLQLLLGVPALVGVAVVGPFVLGLLGEVYAAASVTLLVLVASAPALAVVSLVGARLRAQRRDGAAAALNVVSGVTTLPLALWWVGSFGPSGVAAAFAVSQTFGAVLGLVLARRPFVGAS
jgi:O-antigen/teichoic acid export membrane protein